jgi:hypothetical protein
MDKQLVLDRLDKQAFYSHEIPSKNGTGRPKGWACARFTKTAVHPFLLTEKRGYSIASLAGKAAASLTSM